MSKLRVESYSISLDGYGAGPDQSLKAPLGVGGEALHGWAMATKTFQKAVFGKDGGNAGVDEDFASRGFRNIGSWILGRNMFGPVRGPWPDEEWKGWWGNNPPYHCDIYVLTHHPRKSFTLEGNNTFHFVTEGIHKALELAKASAKGQDVRLGGGASVIRQYLQAKLIDEMHYAVSPVLLGSGESPFAGLDLPALGYKVAEHVNTPAATHVVLKKS